MKSIERERYSGNIICFNFNLNCRVLLQEQERKGALVNPLGISEKNAEMIDQQCFHNCVVSTLFFEI